MGWEEVVAIYIAAVVIEEVVGWFTGSCLFTC